MLNECYPTSIRKMYALLSSDSVYDFRNEFIKVQNSFSSNYKGHLKYVMGDSFLEKLVIY